MEDYNEKYSKDLRDKIVREAQEPRRRLEHRSGRVFGGSVLVIIGAVLLARQYGIELPEWLFSWGTLLVALGLFIGAKHSFRGFGWFIPIIIGGVILIENFVPELSIRHYIWPLLIICFGLFMIFRPRHHHRRDWGWEPGVSSEDSIDATSIFGSTKKSIISKDFKGGDITTVFGGTDLNLTQADINGTVMIDVTQVFGGTKLIVPAHWSIKSDVVCIFGGIEDKRPQSKDITDPPKILKLDGTCIFGGIEIKSF
jgi:predicted membrane protein